MAGTYPLLERLGYPVGRPGGEWRVRVTAF
jgi:hypothetical protein